MTDITCDDFNKRFIVGQPVFLELDDGSLMETYLRSPAWVIGGGDIIAKVKGKTGGWLIERIHPRTEDNPTSNNIDITINIADEDKEATIKHYIRSTMSSASYEVFEREYVPGSLYDAAGKALLNEILVELIIKGMLMDKNELFLKIEAERKTELNNDELFNQRRS